MWLHATISYRDAHEIRYQGIFDMGTKISKEDMTGDAINAQSGIIGSYVTGVGPGGIAIDTYGNVWVIDIGDNTVTEFAGVGPRRTIPSLQRTAMVRWGELLKDQELQHNVRHI